MKDNKTKTIDEIIQEYHLAIFRYCRSRLNNHHQAEDVTSDVMCTLFEKWDKLKQDNIKAWLYRVADKLIKNTYKMMKQEKERRLPNRDGKIFYKSSNTRDKTFHEPSTYDNYNEFNEKVYTDEIYKKLSDEEKTIYDLRYRNRLTLKQTAKELNMPYGTLYYKDKQLVDKLKKFIKEIADRIEI